MSITIGFWLWYKILNSDKSPWTKFAFWYKFLIKPRISFNSLIGSFGNVISLSFGAGIDPKPIYSMIKILFFTWIGSGTLKPAL